jgi:hypothetical protein
MVALVLGFFAGSIDEARRTNRHASAIPVTPAGMDPVGIGEACAGGELDWTDRVALPTWVDPDAGAIMRRREAVDRHARIGFRGARDLHLAGTQPSALSVTPARDHLRIVWAPPQGDSADSANQPAADHAPYPISIIHMLLKGSR